MPRFVPPDAFGVIYIPSHEKCFQNPGLCYQKWEKNKFPKLHQHILMDNPKRAMQCINDFMKTHGEYGSGDDTINQMHIGFSPLHIAVLKHNLQFTVQLIKAGANVECRIGPTEETLLKACNILASAHVTGLNSLHIACLYGDKDIVTALLEAGANPDAFDTGKRGRTPLIYACEHAHKEIVELLLKYGADVHARGRDGLTPISALSTCDKFYPKKRIRSQLRKHTYSFIINKLLEIVFENTVCMKKSFLEPTSSYKQLVNKKRNYIHKRILSDGISDERFELEVNKQLGEVNSRFKGVTPLMLASLKGDEKKVSILLRRGAIPALKTFDKRGENALMFACAAGNVNIVKMLLHRTNPNESSGLYGKTPLMHAVEGNQMEVVKYLLTNGVDVDVGNGAGETPLLVAARLARPAMMRYLLLRGADINKQNQYGEGCLEAALRHLPMRETYIQRHFLPEAHWSGGIKDEEVETLLRQDGQARAAVVHILLRNQITIRQEEEPVLPF